MLDTRDVGHMLHSCYAPPSGCNTQGTNADMCVLIDTNVGDASGYVDSPAKAPCFRAPCG